MQFRIANTFTGSLAKLTGDEQKTVKTTAFDLQMDPSSRGMRFHKLDRAKDKHFWSVRASGDLRIIVHKTDANLLLCYVDHHDDAYAWAERRKIERHPTTGAAQLVEIREEEIDVVTPEGDINLANDFVFALTGYHPDSGFLSKVGIEVDPDTYVPAHNPSTLETNVKGVYLAGSIISGRMTNRIFIENGRFHGGQIVPDIVAALERINSRTGR